MQRRVVKFFHEPTITKELDRLPARDANKLLDALVAYRDGDPTGYQIKVYKNHGISMLTDAGRGHGRALYFMENQEGSTIILMVYKKESQKADQTAVQSAVQRKKKYEQKN